MAGRVYTEQVVETKDFCGFCDEPVHPERDGDALLWDYCTCIYGWRDRGVIEE